MSNGRPLSDHEIDKLNERHEKTWDSVSQIVLYVSATVFGCLLVWCTRDIILKHLDEPGWVKVLIALIEAAPPFVVLYLCRRFTAKTERSLQQTNAGVESLLTHQEKPAVLPAKDGVEEGAGEPPPR